MSIETEAMGAAAFQMVCILMGRLAAKGALTLEESVEMLDAVALGFEERMNNPALAGAAPQNHEARRLCLELRDTVAAKRGPVAP